ncbi:Cytoplasmic tRNA 2-thiolation protein 2 [Erysiphe neolycopersici]|uniref:Cytoplasmic tRNA 2-thiolation protein 2 n=1 Tax=Erysiphe neolycopersici TaxID=212602 RepID=A0A420HK83_9PEZI|nr:Cytoplasmic tRNA 2-thiolation protein 2 [Erysiphe neolycopersici]
MEGYRVRGSKLQAPKKLLLPLSYGPCSSSLLQILDNHLQGQYDRMKRVAYELVVVHIDLYVTASDREFSARKLEQFKSRFPRHQFISFGLEESLRLEEIGWASLGIARLSESESPTEKLRQYLTSVKSPTDRADIISILLTRLLVHIGKKNNCSSILFGDSTTKLAEKTLTETAKGRGISLPWQICDGTSAHGIGFNYPMRDLLKKEIVTFCLLTSSLESLIIFDQIASVSANPKSITINDLMLQYFQSTEENYPSIVANVVRTVSKLSVAADKTKISCGVCGFPSISNEIFSKQSHQASDIILSTDKSDLEKTICHGCLKLVTISK